jgi:MFS family permease
MIENSSEQANDNETITLQNSNSHKHLNARQSEENSNTMSMKKDAEKKFQIVLWLKNKRDLKSIVLLILLYIIQGLPFGLSTAIPLILGSRRASYQDQGTFSFAFYPLALKLLWAPIVDSVFIERIGRRKTWMIPCQFLSGIILLISAQYVNNLLDYEKENDAKSDIYALTFIFVIINIISATQDIVLGKKNIIF